MPPIDGLQLICPSVSIECVSSNVDAPIRAEASAASVPAWPPPTTMTSKCRGKCMRPLSVRADCIFPGSVAWPPRGKTGGGRTDHLGMVDAVLEIARTGDGEAQRRVERLEARLGRDAN